MILEQKNHFEWVRDFAPIGWIGRKEKNELGGFYYIMWSIFLSKPFLSCSRINKTASIHVLLQPLRWSWCIHRGHPCGTCSIILGSCHVATSADEFRICISIVVVQGSGHSGRFLTRRVRKVIGSAPAVLFLTCFHFLFHFQVQLEFTDVSTNHIVIAMQCHQAEWKISAPHENKIPLPPKY